VSKAAPAFPAHQGRCARACGALFAHSGRTCAINRLRDEGAIGVLRQTAIAHLREAPRALDNTGEPIVASATVILKH
jgi:hypothetical protein